MYNLLIESWLYDTEERTISNCVATFQTEADADYACEVVNMIANSQAIKLYKPSAPLTFPELSQ